MKTVRTSLAVFALCLAVSGAAVVALWPDNGFWREGPKVSWGWNYYGQLGNNSTGDSLVIWNSSDIDFGRPNICTAKKYPVSSLCETATPVSTTSGSSMFLRWPGECFQPSTKFCASSSVVNPSELYA